MPVIGPMEFSHRIGRLLLAAATSAVAFATICPATSFAGPVRSTATQRMKAANVARSAVGRPYAWGAAGPRAFDCSGLVAYSYARARHALGVRTSFQMWRLGHRVSRAALRRGDLVFTWDPRKGHVGVYLGGGRYVHAPGSGRRVQVAPLPRAGYYGAVRP
jgi:cell wall-associated NlpC family hydrolase